MANMICGHCGARTQYMSHVEICAIVAGLNPRVMTKGDVPVTRDAPMAMAGTLQGGVVSFADLDLTGGASATWTEPERDEDGTPVWCGVCEEVVAEGRGWFHTRCHLIP